VKELVNIYRKQAEIGMKYLHMHRNGATKWGLKEIAEMNQKIGIPGYTVEKCTAPGRRQGQGRQMQVQTNSSNIHDALLHRPKSAALKPYIAHGIGHDIFDAENKVKKLLHVEATTKMPKTNRTDEDHEDLEAAWDDLTGAMLDTKEVIKARSKEIEYADKKGVWIKIPRSEALAKGWKIVKTRWLDINKGDAMAPLYRSRFVAKEFRSKELEGLFAGTPPLEALRLLLSDVATIGEEEEDKVMMINDVSRAFFEAPIARDVCIELPAECMTEEDRSKDMVGKLKQSLYGTQDAAANFQAEVKRFMLSIGFQQGRYSPCTYFHPQRRLRTLVHGDDFVTTGTRGQAWWFRQKLEERFEMKTVVVGRGDGEVREARILNRVVRARDDGWEYEADQRHVDILIREMKLENAKGVATPCEDLKIWEEEMDVSKLNADEATVFRRLAARANFLAQDRADLQFASKEACRGMADPCRGDVKKLKRLVRYLIDHPRLVIHYKWQRRPWTSRTYTDSDWAGCRRTAKSTSGGVIVIGSHYIRSWSSTQKTIALSSGEAELTAMVKASCEAIGMAQLARDWGIEMDSDIYVDSSAAIGVVNRKGNGKLRHVRVGQLWIQEKRESEEIRYHKVKGVENPADMMTKGINRSARQGLMKQIGLRFEEGRADASLRA